MLIKLILQFFSLAENNPHEKINQCLTDINQCLTDTEYQFSKELVTLVKYWLSIGLYWLYQLNIGLLKFLPCDF